MVNAITDIEHYPQYHYHQSLNVTFYKTKVLETALVVFILGNKHNANTMDIYIYIFISIYI